MHLTPNPSDPHTHTHTHTAAQYFVRWCLFLSVYLISYSKYTQMHSHIYLFTGVWCTNLLESGSVSGNRDTNTAFERYLQAAGSVNQGNRSICYHTFLPYRGTNRKERTWTHIVLVTHDINIDKVLNINNTGILFNILNCLVLINCFTVKSYYLQLSHYIVACCVIVNPYQISMLYHVHWEFKTHRYIH